MMSTEISQRIGKSRTYLHSLKKNCPNSFNFYLNYGDGDVEKGINKSIDDCESLKYDVYELWIYTKETKGMTIEKLIEPVVDNFNSIKSANVIIYKWITSMSQRSKKIEKKINVLKKIVDCNLKLIEKIKKENK